MLFFKNYVNTFSMIKTKLAIITDCVLVGICVFFVSFVWLNKYIKNAILSFLISNFITFLVVFAVFKIAIKKHGLQKMTNADLKLSKKSFDTLLFYDKKSYQNYFENLLGASYVSGKIYQSKTLYFYVETKLPLSEADLFAANEFLLTHKKLPLCFVCKQAGDNFLNLLKISPIPFEVYDEKDVFLLMKQLNKFPFANEPPIRRRTKIKNLVMTKFFSSLTRNHFKDFFISGAALLVLSMFIPFSKLYMISGSILLILSVVSLFFKDKNLPKQGKTKLLSILSEKSSDKSAPPPKL